MKSMDDYISSYTFPLSNGRFIHACRMSPLHLKPGRYVNYNDSVVHVPSFGPDYKDYPDVVPPVSEIYGKWLICVLPDKRSIFSFTNHEMIAISSDGSEVNWCIDYPVGYVLHTFNLLHSDKSVNKVVTKYIIERG